jgi:hypothetical protein
MNTTPPGERAFDQAFRLGRRLPVPVKQVVKPMAVNFRNKVRTLGTKPELKRPTLDEIGLEQGTDKSTRAHGYLPIYEQYLGHLRDETFDLIEIGVFKGASLRTWAEYFPHARVLGVDFHDSGRYATDRIRIERGDQGSPEWRTEFAARVAPLVFIDDASHKWSHQIDTFRDLFPSVRPGGYYILEDIQTSFGPKYAEIYGLGPETAYDYMAGVIRGVVAAKFADEPRDDFEVYCRKHIESVILLKHVVILRKKASPKDASSGG